MNFADQNRAAIASYAKSPYAKAPGVTNRQYLDANGDPTNTPQPLVLDFVAPNSFPSTTKKDETPTATAPQQTPTRTAPEQPWVAGVPNWLTGLTVVAVGVAIYQTVTGASRKNPSDEKNRNGMTWPDWADAAGYPAKHPGYTAREFLKLRKDAWRDGRCPHAFGARFE